MEKCRCGGRWRTRVTLQGGAGGGVGRVDEVERGAERQAGGVCVIRHAHAPHACPLAPVLFFQHSAEFEIVIECPALPLHTYMKRPPPPHPLRRSPPRTCLPPPAFGGGCEV